MQRTKSPLKAVVDKKQAPKRLPDAVCGSPKIKFAQISTDMLRDKKLTWKAKGILALLLSNKGGEWVSFSKTLESFAIDGPDSLRTGLKELENAGYLLRLMYVDKKTKRRMGSFWVYSHFPNTFEIEEHLKLLEKNGLELQNINVKPGLEFPNVAFPNVAFPNVDNPALIILNNNKIKNKNTKKGFFEILNLFPDEWKNEETFHNNLKDYVQHRKEKGSSLTKVASSRLVSKLKEYSIQEASAALAKSVENGWTGVFPESAKSSSSKKPNRNGIITNPDTGCNARVHVQSQTNFKGGQNS